MNNNKGSLFKITQFANNLQYKLYTLKIYVYIIVENMICMIALIFGILEEIKIQ